MLEFRADMLEREVRAFFELGKEVMDKSAEDTARSLTRQIDQAKSRPEGTTVRWSIPRDRPLQTRVSHGEYERGNRKGEDVYADMSFEIGRAHV